MFPVTDFLNLLNMENSPSDEFVYCNFCWKRLPFAL